MRRILCALLALVTVLSLSVSAMAAEDSPVRLTHVEIYSEGKIYQSVDISYYTGTHMHERHDLQYMYDETGEEPAGSVESTVVYDENGREVSSSNTYMEAGEISATAESRNTYGDNGGIAERAIDTVQGGETTTSVTSYTYEFAPNGYPATILEQIDGEDYMRRVYTYDEQDRVATIDNQMLMYGWSYFNEYVYDDQDRVVANRVTFDNGAPGTYWEYTYDPDLYFDLRYSVEYSEDGLKPNGTTFYAEVPVRGERTGVSFSLAGAPELTYDDDGYLIRADSGNGNYIEFTYEPCA